MASSENSRTSSRHPRRRGEEARKRIVLFLYAAKRRGQRTFTLDELSTATGYSRSAIDHHLKWLEAEGTVVLGAARREILLVKDPPVEAPVFQELAP